MARAAWWGKNIRLQQHPYGRERGGKWVPSVMGKPEARKRVRIDPRDDGCAKKSNGRKDQGGAGPICRMTKRAN